jgi:hypothetical protein
MLHLTRHPATTCSPIVDIRGEAVRQGDCLTLRFEAVGATAELSIPSPAPSVRSVDLWRHTCFEAFVRDANTPGYLELNLSPSTAWAAYRFKGYRENMTPAQVAPRRIEVAVREDGLTLSTTIDLGGSDLDTKALWQAGLSAVIEDRAGAVSYWALAHPPGKPDFHSPDCFVLELPAPAGA